MNIYELIYTYILHSTETAKVYDTVINSTPVKKIYYQQRIMDECDRNVKQAILQTIFVQRQLKCDGT